MDLQKTRFLETTLRSPLMHLPVRSAVFELSDGRVLFSPGSQITAEQHQSAGAVTDIVASSLMHTAGMKKAAEAHPNARLWGPAGAKEKHPELRWHGTLGVDPWPYESELSLVPLAGMPKLNEIAAYHRPSQALYLTDMVFNIPRPKGLLAWMFFLTFGTYRRFAVSKLFLRYIKDRAAFDAAITKLTGLDFRHVVPSHGEPILNEGKPRLLAALRERGILEERG